MNKRVEMQIKQNKLILILLFIINSSLFSYEIIIDKTRKVDFSTFERNNATFERNNQKEVVVDSATGLMWQDNSDAQNVKKTWSDAKSYCKNLSYSGYSDWYLPTISELESLVDTKRYNPAIKKGFKNIISSYYLSSSPLVSGSKYAWYMDFKNGNSYYYNKTNSRYVRCARAGQ